MASSLRKGICPSSCDGTVHLRGKMKDVLWWLSSDIQTQMLLKTPRENWRLFAFFFKEFKSTKAHSAKDLKKSQKHDIQKGNAFWTLLSSSGNIGPSLCWEMVLKDQIKRQPRITLKGISLSFIYNEQMDGWPFNSTIIASHSISNRGFDNQGHLPEALWIHFSWHHGLVRNSRTALCEDYLPSQRRPSTDIFVSCVFTKI